MGPTHRLADYEADRPAGLNRSTRSAQPPASEPDPERAFAEHPDLQALHRHLTQWYSD